VLGPVAIGWDCAACSTMSFGGVAGVAHPYIQHITRLVSVVSHTMNEGVVESDHLAFHPPSRLGPHRHIHLAIRDEQGQVSTQPRRTTKVRL